jgi:hypothetical protein
MGRHRSDTRPIMAWVPHVEREALERLAAERGVRLSDIVREAIATYISSNGGERDADQGVERLARKGEESGR